MGLHLGQPPVLYLGAQLQDQSCLMHLLMIWRQELNTPLAISLMIPDWEVFTLLRGSRWLKPSSGMLKLELGSISWPRVWSNTGIGILLWWLMSQACQCLRCIWIMPLITYFNFWSALKWLGRWIRGWIVANCFCWSIVFYDMLYYSVLFYSIPFYSIPFLEGLEYLETLCPREHDLDNKHT